MTETRTSLLKNFLIVGTGQIFAVVLNVILLSVLTRSLSVESFGYFQLFLSLVLGLSFFTLPGFNQVAIKGAAKGEDGVMYLVNRYRAYGGVFLSIVMAVTGAIFWLTGYQPRLGVLLMLGSLYVLLLPFQSFDSFLTGKSRFDLSRMISVGVAMIKILIVGGAAWATKDLFFVLIAFIGVELLTVIAGQYLAQNIATGSDLPHEAKEYYRGYGLRMSGVAALNVFALRLEQIILGLMRPELLAIYSIGALIPKRIRANIQPLMGVLNVRWIQLPARKNTEKIKQYWWVFLGGGTLIFGIIWIILPWIIPFLFGGDYAASVSIARWLSLPLIFHFFYRSVINVAIYQGGEQFYTKVQIIFNVLKIVLFFLLVPVYQIRGAIITILLIEILMFLTVLTWFIRRYNAIMDAQPSQ